MRGAGAETYEGFNVRTIHFESVHINAGMAFLPYIFIKLKETI